MSPATSYRKKVMQNLLMRIEQDVAALRKLQSEMGSEGDADKIHELEKDIRRTI